MMRWAGPELPEELRSVLASADLDASDAAIKRLRARLDGALGPAFAETQPALEARASSVRGAERLARAKWLGLGAIVAAGVGALLLGGTRPEAPAMSRLLPPSAANVQPLSSADASQHAPELPAEAPQVDLDPPLVQPQPMTARPTKHNAQPRSAAGGLAEELRQLKQIRLHVTTDPARALAEADAHVRRFPQGTLGPERELLRIDALLRLGRNAEAQKLGARELAAPGGNPYRARIEKLLSAR